jgi:hypothetical protein
MIDHPIQRRLIGKLWRGICWYRSRFACNCATELIRADAKLYNVTELLGHESIATLEVKSPAGGVPNRTTRPTAR